MKRYAHHLPRRTCVRLKPRAVDLNERHTSLRRVNEARTVDISCGSGTQGGKNGRSRSKEVKNKEKEVVVVVV